MAYAVERQSDPTLIGWLVPVVRADVISRPSRCYKVGMKPLLSMVGLLLLTGCGFQLRSWDLASAYRIAHIESDVDSSIERDLRGAFESAGLAVVEEGEAEAEAEADLVLAIEREDFEQRSGMYTGDGRVAGYQLRLRVAYQANNAIGKSLVSSRTVLEERAFPLNRANVLGSDAEKRLLMQEMRDDIVERIVRTLSLVSDSAAKPIDAS